jgi:hypothetical protein
MGNDNMAITFPKHCVKLPRRRIPKGDWFCDGCKQLNDNKSKVDEGDDTWDGGM